MAAYGAGIAGLIQREGGLVNDPDDAGGLTNFGISQRSYPNLDIASLTKDDAARIYQQDFQSKLPPGLSPASQKVWMDASVLMGPTGAKKAFAGAQDYEVNTLLDLSRARLNQISNNPDKAKYKQGWNNRMDSLEREVTGELRNPNLDTTGVEIRPNPMKQQEMQAAYLQGIQQEEAGPMAAFAQIGRGTRNYAQNPLVYGSLQDYRGY